MSPRTIVVLVVSLLVAFFAHEPVLTFSWSMGAVPVDDVEARPASFEGRTFWVYGLGLGPVRTVTSSKTGLPVDEFRLVGREGKPFPLVVDPPADDRWNQQGAVREHLAADRRTVVLARARVEKKRLVADRVRTAAFLEWLLRVAPTEESLMRGARR